MYKKMLCDFSNQNPERFNSDFILSKNDDDILNEVKNIFKSLEILDEVHIDDVSIDNNEEDFGPIKQQGKYYKSPLESRLIKIHYKVRIDGRPDPIEKDMFLPKMLDHCFYYNEGVRFFPIWQVVDNLSYATNNGVSLKSLMMPITMIVLDPFNEQPYGDKKLVEGIPNYYALIFNKKVSPLYYFMCKFALDSLTKAGISPYADLDKFQNFSDPTLIDSLCKFMKIDAKFSDDPTTLVEDGRTVFTLSEKNKTGVSFSMKDSDIQTVSGKIFLGMVLDTRLKEKKTKLVFNYSDMTRPWFWLDSLIEASGFSKSADAFKRYEKIKGVYTSLSRIIDDQTKESLTISSEDKEDIFTVMRYLLVNFDTLFNADPQNLHNKRIRLYEYILFPLRVYFGQHINRIVNLQTSRDVASVEKIFTSLTPMFLLKNLITSQLLRTYNATNDFDLFSAYLKGTFKGPQALGKGVSLEQRDLNPSYMGRIGLVAASPGDPGVSFTFSPFVQVYDGYFDKNAADKSKD